MKIAHVVKFLPPCGGGMGMVAHSYAEQLFELGHEVTVFIPKTNNSEVRNKKYAVKELWPLMRYGNGAFLPQLIWHLRKFDIIHLHYPFFGAAHAVAILKYFKKDKIKLVLSYHMDAEGEGMKKRFFNYYKTYAAPFIFRNSDKIIVSSEDYARNSDIQDYYFKNKNKFVELPFGVPRFFHPEKKDSELMKKYKFSINDKIALFVGGLDAAHYFKGVNFLIEAINKIDDRSIKALIVGEGNLRSRYEKEVKKMGLENRIKFSGFVLPCDLSKYYNLGDIFVLPSINKAEAFGIVLIEAMASGLPLLASNLKGVRSVVHPGINGVLFEPSNSRDIADKIQYVCNNPSLAKEFVARGLNLVDEKYRWSVIAKKLERVYLNLLKRD